MHSVTLSVAIATYNGEKYIKDQLRSIATQSIKPTEIVISDDCSTDNTIKIIREFAEKTEIKFKIIESDIRLGVIENFYKAFRNCSCDYIAYCDQDDIWTHDKVELCIDVLNKHNASLVIHKSRVVDQDFNDLGFSLPDIHGSRAINSPSCVHVIHGFGHQMIFDRCLLTYMQQIRYASVEKLNYWTECFDYYIPLIAGMFGTIYFIDADLVYFRRHNQSTTSAGKIRKQTTALERLAAKVDELHAYSERLSALKEYLVCRHVKHDDPFPTVSDTYLRYISYILEMLALRQVIYSRAGIVRRLYSLYTILLWRGYRPKQHGAFGVKAFLLDVTVAIVPRKLLFSCINEAI